MIGNDCDAIASGSLRAVRRRFPYFAGTEMNMGSRIAIAEDERPIRELLAHHLKRDGFTVLEVADGPSTLRVCREGIDLLLLDIGLPGVDGFDIIRAMRREGRTTPIVVVSARVDEVDRIVAFELGVDDYVVKPFSPREVVVRVHALLRRSGTKHETGPRILRFGRLEVDESAREVRVDGKTVELKPREYALFVALASNAGVAMSRDTLLQRVWGFDFDGDERTVDVHVRRLRMKLEEERGVGRCLQTLHGFGYKFAPG